MTNDVTEGNWVYCVIAIPGGLEGVFATWAGAKNYIERQLGGEVGEDYDIETWQLEE